MNPRTELDHERVVIALQAVIGNLDYDLHKAVMGVEGDEDGYDVMADHFVWAYHSSARTRDRLSR